MPWFRRRHIDDIDALRHRVDELTHTLDETRNESRGESRNEARVDIGDLPPPAPASSVDELVAQLRLVAEATTTTSVNTARLLDERIAVLAAQVAEVDSRERDTSTRVAARLDELASHLDHQLRELTDELDAQRSHHTDAMAALASVNTSALSDATDAHQLNVNTLDELRANQTRIANELARHRIAVTADLATLVDSLGSRPTPARAPASGATP